MPNTTVASGAHHRDEQHLRLQVARPRGRPIEIGLGGPAGDRRSPTGRQRRRCDGLRRRAHPHGRDHAQVVRERDRRAEHDHDAEPAVAVVDRRIDQIDLAEEAGRAREPGQRQHRDRHRPCEQRPRGPDAVQRRDVVPEVGLALARDDHGERGEVHQRVGHQVEDRRPHAERGRHDHAGHHVAGLRDRRVGEHPLQRRLPDRTHVADHDRDHREHSERRRPRVARGRSAQRRTAAAAPRTPPPSSPPP